MTASKQFSSTRCQQQTAQRRSNNSMCKGVIRLSLLLVGLLASTLPKALADTCPPGAVATGVGLVLTAFRSNSVTGTLVPIGPTGVGICETIFLQASLSYVPTDAQGNTVAAYSGGSNRIFTLSSSLNANVTPIGGVPKI